MAKYRDHRGGLSESLKTTIEISVKGDIVKRLNSNLKDFGAEVAEIKFKYCGFDKRTGWDTYYVLQRLKGEIGFTVAGMCNRSF